jgi:hypothetical protein
MELLKLEELVVNFEDLYPRASAMFLDAMALNAGHGRTMSNFDRAHCVILATKHKLMPEQVATALAISVEKVGELSSDRTGKLKSISGNGRIPLKRTIHHMAGQTLTKTQAEAQDKLGGMDQMFYVNQLLILIENDMLDRDNDRLMKGLKRLADLIGKLGKKAA